MKNVFIHGDIIKGIADNGYSVTTEQTKMRVIALAGDVSSRGTRIEPDKMEVVILGGENDIYAGRKYIVNNDNREFEIYNDKKIVDTRFKDFVKNAYDNLNNSTMIVKKNRYGRDPESVQTGLYKDNIKIKQQNDCTFLIIDGRYTICIPTTDDILGIAVRNDGDLLNEEIGMALAFSRSYSKTH